MTKKLEELFDLPSSTDPEEDLVYTPEETQSIMTEIDDAIDKIDAALPGVRDLSSSDTEMDELATLAKDSYKDLMDLGMNVDSRFAAEIFSVAGAMLGHALTAKQAKLNKKLKMIDLQLKKANLDAKLLDSDKAPVQQGQGHVLDRNELLDRLLGDRKTNAKKG
ncbi:hypothetical protein N9972_00340 [bacterium]|nr:hypothetical protein [bacterium]